MKWSGRRAYVGAICGGFAGPFIISTQSIIPSTFIRISIAVIFSIVVATSVNKQIEYIYETFYLVHSLSSEQVSLQDIEHGGQFSFQRKQLEDHLTKGTLTATTKSKSKLPQKR